MIEFHLDTRTGVAPYLQLVQQVRRALKLGLLHEGDQLPTVKEVVARLAINPNTVLKAYRELEHDDLVAARPGIGTFVTGTLSDPSLAAHGPLRQDLQRWLIKARRRRTRRREHRSALPGILSIRPSRGRSVSAVIEARGLGKRYGRKAALSDCTLEIPSGHVVGLVGPNGAGKSTLLNLAVGLLAPTSGTIEVLGRAPACDAAQLGRVGFVAQDTPLFSGLSVAEHLELGFRLNPGWDRTVAEDRIDQLGLDPGQRAGKLSGGQRAQLALTLAVAKRPEFLVLDEPVASLDPLARREFLQILMETVADQEVSVILSSHLVADLERVCDFLVVLVASRVQLAGPVDELLASHHRLIGAPRDPSTLPATQEIIEASQTDRQSTFLVRTEEPIHDPSWTVEEIGLEDLVLAYMGQAAAAKRSRQRPMGLLK